MPRVLILTADVGAGHDLPAQLLADALLQRGAEVAIADGLDAMGPVIHSIMRGSTETVLHRMPWLFDAEYWLMTAFPPTRWLTVALGVVLGGPGLRRLLRRAAPDVIVSTYPGTTQLLGMARRAGRLAVPVVSAVTDLASLRFWAHPGIDEHHVIHAESDAEVREYAGPAAAIRHVRGYSRPQFEAPPARAQARAALGLPAAGGVAVVSGGGWGVGDLEQAASAVLAIPGATAVCLCGNNAGLRERLERDFAGEPRVRAEGFTDRIPEWLAAADALVHSTAGLTVLEAQMTGTWAISWGWGIGHIRTNNRAYRRFGLAEVADTPTQLAAALQHAFTAPRTPDRSFAALPAAADAVLALTRPPDGSPRPGA